MHQIRRGLHLYWTFLLLFTLLVGGANWALAADYPAKQVQILVPVAPGGPMDMIARVLGDKLSQKWGKPVLVVNKPGAGQVTATHAVAIGPDDGYSLLLMGHVFTMNPWLFKKLPYANEDLVPITKLTATPLILVVNPNLPIHSLQDLIAYAKVNPRKLYYGSSGPSSSLRFAGELLKSMAKIDIVHVPYDGNGPMTLAIMSGEMSFGFVNPVSLPFIREGKLRPIAITSSTRSPQLPDVPTVSEAGLPGYETGSWFGLMGPKGMPDSIIRKINADIREVLAQPEIVERLESVDAAPSPNSPEDFAKEIKVELEKWRVLIKELNITLE